MSKHLLGSRHDKRGRGVILTVVSFKGGVGKTTTAIHLAGYLQRHGPTLLVDGDSNRSAIQWAAAGRLPFVVADEMESPKLLMSGKYQNVVIDTAARPTEEELSSLAKGCDLLIVPCSPDALSLGAMLQMVGPLQALKADFRVLLTIIPPRPNNAGAEARSSLTEAGLPLFTSGIRRLNAFQRAALEGCLVQDVGDRYGGIAWDCYESVGREVVA